MVNKKKQLLRVTSVRESEEELRKFDEQCSRFGIGRSTALRMYIRSVNRTGNLHIVPLDDEDKK